MVRVIFTDGGKISSSLIKLGTWSDWSHTSILLPNDKIIDSTMTYGGVKIREYKDLRAKARKIEVFDADWLNPEMIEHLKTQLGKPYDWGMILGFPFQRNWQSEDKWFCSELVAWGAAKAGTPMINKESWRVTPQDVFETCVKR